MLLRRCIRARAWLVVAAVVVCVYALSLRSVTTPTTTATTTAADATASAPACPHPPHRQLPELVQLGIDTSTLCMCLPPEATPTPQQQQRGDGDGAADAELGRRTLPSVTAIIPLYEQTEFLMACLQSLLNQTVPLQEIVVVNDGSPSTPELKRALDAAAALDPRRVRVVHQPHRGLPAARNTGIQQSQGELLFFIDPDDMAHAQTVELLAQAAEVYQVDFAWGDILFFGDMSLIWRTQEYNAYDLLWSNHPASQALVRRSALERYGGYDERLRDGMEDWAFWTRLAAMGATGKRVPLPTFQYRRHKRAMSHTVNTRKSAIVRQTVRANAFAYAPERVREIKLQNRPLISVIVPFHNTLPEWATQALQSLDAQTLRDFEVIVVDDGSTDEMASQWLRQQEQNGGGANWTFPLRIIRQPTAQGPAAARNLGVRAARGDMISFLDADDLLTPTSFEKLALRLLLANNTVAYAYGAVRHFGAINGTSRDAFDARRLLRENFLAIFGVMWKAVYMRIGGMDAAFDGHEDYDLWLRAMQFGFRGAYVDEVCLEYRRHFKGRTGLIRRTSSFEAEHRKLRERNPLLYGKPCTPQMQYAPMIRDADADELASSASEEQQQQQQQQKLALRRAFQRKVRRSRAAVVPSAPLKEDSYRRPPHPLPFTPERHAPGAKPAIIYAVPLMAVGGSEVVDLSLLHGLASIYHITLVVESADNTEWEARFNGAVDEMFVMSRLASSAEQNAALIDYLIVTRNACLIFNRNSQHAYEMSPFLRRKYPQLRQVDLIHLYEPTYGAWDRFSAPFHAQYHARFVISEDLRQYMSTKYKLPATDFTVVRNGIDMRNCSALASDSAAIAKLDAEAVANLVIGFVGRFEEQKQPGRFVRIAKAIALLEPKARFLMIGHGPLRRGVEDAVERERLNVEFAQAPMPAVLAGMSILLSTSSFEGVPLVMIEAGATGVMTVASDVGAVREVAFPLMGMVYPMTEADDVVATRVLGAWKSDTVERRRLRRQVAFETFDEKRMQAEYIDTLSGLIGSRNASRAHEDFVARLIDKPFLTV
jgi:glycosyltransferase involved in cell wall biosynthesis